ncbi:MAG: 1,6-anhydro-N-acetylmuramyl-L-alanine amidase AmpD [Burkholderiaceae bacterium]
MHWSAGAPGWLHEARRCPSPHADERPPGTTVELLVLHHISLPAGHFAGEAIEQLFCARLDCASHPSFGELRGLQVSSHFLIRRHGQLLQFVNVRQRAWHAGRSSFLGRERCNDFSVGVELEGDHRRAFTASQYRRLLQLIGALRQTLPLRHLAAHSDIAPGRKTDPGRHFDWSRVLGHEVARGLSRPVDHDGFCRPEPRSRGFAGSSGGPLLTYCASLRRLA